MFFLFEGNIHSFRQIFLDGRKHPDDLEPTWYGHSVGHWEGDTLVVDTVGFNDRFWFDFKGHPHTTQLHMIERYTRTRLRHARERHHDHRSGRLREAFHDKIRGSPQARLGSHGVHLQRKQPGRQTHSGQRRAVIQAPVQPGDCELRHGWPDTQPLSLRPGISIASVASIVMARSGASVRARLARLRRVRLLVRRLAPAPAPSAQAPVPQVPPRKRRRLNLPPLPRPPLRPRRRAPQHRPRPPGRRRRGGSSSCCLPTAPVPQPASSRHWRRSSATRRARLRGAQHRRRRGRHRAAGSGPGQATYAVAVGSKAAAIGAGDCTCDGLLPGGLARGPWPPTASTASPRCRRWRCSSGPGRSSRRASRASR